MFVWFSWSKQDLYLYRNNRSVSIFVFCFVSVFVLRIMIMICQALLDKWTHNTVKPFSLISSCASSFVSYQNIGKPFWQGHLLPVFVLRDLVKLWSCDFCVFSQFSCFMSPSVYSLLYLCFMSRCFCVSCDLSHAAFFLYFATNLSRLWLFDFLRYKQTFPGFVHSTVVKRSWSLDFCVTIMISGFL